VLITAAIGIEFFGRWLSERLGSWFNSDGVGAYLRPSLATILVLGSLVATINATPHFRLYTNALGGGMARAGYYFPHDEFYDASMRDVIREIAQQAKPGVTVASESTTLAGYYAERFNRQDLKCVSLSDPEALSQLRESDFIIVERGRRYFSNDALLAALSQSVTPTFTHKLSGVAAADVYLVDAKVLGIVGAR
jgi:hypothetical protein